MTGDQEAFKKALDNGTSAAWDQQWDKAEQHYREALEQFPDHPLALANLGLALVEQGMLEKALPVYHHLVKVTPDNPEAHDRTARILERMGKLADAVRWGMQAAELHTRNRDIEKAVDIWQWCLNINPELAPAHARLGAVYERMGRKALAVEAYLSVAVIEQKTDKPERASQWVERALHLAPDSAEAQQAQKALLSSKVIPPVTLSRRSTGRKITPTSGAAQAQDIAGSTGMTPIESAKQSALAFLAGMLFDQVETTQQSGDGGADEAHGKRSGLFGGAQPDPARMQQHLAAAIEAQSLGQYKQAADQLQRVLEIGVKHPAIYFILGWLNFGVDGKRSQKYLASAQAAPEYSLAACLLMGEALVRDKKFGEAAGNYLQALRLADTQIVPAEQSEEMLQIYEPIIESYDAKKDENHAREICDAISKLLNRPDWRGYLSALRQQLPEAVRGAPPIPVAQQLLETGSSDVLTTMMTIRQLGQAGKYYAAVEEAYRAIYNSPSYLPLQVQVGELLLRSGRIQAGVEKLGHVANLYAIRGDSGQAVRLLLRSAQAAPMDLAVRHRLIDLLVEQGRINDAAQQYLDLGEMYYHLADLDMANKTYQAALAFTEQYNASVQWQGRILTKLADIDMHRLDTRSAAQHIARLRQLLPEDVGTRLAMVNSLMRLGREAEAVAEIDDALRLFATRSMDQSADDLMEKVLGEYPTNLEMRKRLADLYQRTGRIEKAVEQLDHMADTLLSSGNRPGAAAMVRAIIALNPPNAAEYRELLSNILGGGV